MEEQLLHRMMCVGRGRRPRPGELTTKGNEGNFLGDRARLYNLICVVAGHMFNFVKIDQDEHLLYINCASIK